MDAAIDRIIHHGIKLKDTMIPMIPSMTAFIIHPGLNSSHIPNPYIHAVINENVNIKEYSSLIDPRNAKAKLTKGKK
jgi:hypothetical protein